MLRIDTPEQIIDELKYSSYRHNRETFPEVSFEQWRPIFGLATDRMEARYQIEEAFGPAKGPAIYQLEVAS